MAPAAGKAQQWLRLYSENLASSFRASALIQHRVTKGETRERQILDLLEALLPKRTAVEPDVVIADSRDAESPKFDAALLDRLFWPRLFEQNDTAVVMIESVLAAIEIKSFLNAAEIQDVFRKTTLLRGMACAGKGAGPCPPLVCAFAYTCDNLALAFFDFACAYALAPASSATLICVLNEGLLCLCRQDGDSLVPVDVPAAGLIPAAAVLGPDALLMFVYTLSGWASLGGGSLDVYRAYGRHVFATATVVYFEDDYLSAVTGSATVRGKARQAYLRPGSASLTELYKASRRSIGLS